MRVALMPHPDFPCEAVAGLAVEAIREGPRLSLRYQLSGPVADLALPTAAAPQRADGLWRHTCFEAFVRGPGGKAYCEVNLSPSGAWAAYSFDAYRDGMTPTATPAPGIRLAATPQGLTLAAELDFSQAREPPPAAPWRLSLAAVIEEKGGRLSYWALAHPAGRPDFHHPEGFMLELPATERP
jgi:hypothetical protein